jgi:hypothetical protein
MPLDYRRVLGERKAAAASELASDRLATVEVSRG